MSENYQLSQNMTNSYGLNPSLDYRLDYNEDSSEDYESDYQGFSYSGSSDWSDNMGSSASSSESFLGRANPKQSFNFSGLSVSSMTTTPRVWDPLDNFLELVALKLYMFVPSIMCGVLLGLLLWTLTLILIRIGSYVKKRLFMIVSSDKVDIAMEEGGEKGIGNLNKRKWTESESGSGEVREVEVRSGFEREILPPPSPHSSSSSSGIGESENESPSERSSRRDSNIQVESEKKDDFIVEETNSYPEYVDTSQK